MSFFDDLTKKAKVVASAASEKAKEAADTAKISAAIVAEKRELDKNYRAIGQWYVCEYADGEPPAAVADLVAAVKASRRRSPSSRPAGNRWRRPARSPRERCALCAARSASPSSAPTAAPPWRRISDAKRTPGRWSFGRGSVFS